MSKKISRYVSREQRKSRDFDLYYGTGPYGGAAATRRLQSAVEQKIN